MSDPTSPEGRAGIRKRAELAEQSRIYIDELTFHGGEPPVLAWQQIAESQADVPALLDALDAACSRLVAEEHAIEVLRAQVLGYQQTYERDLPHNGGTSGIVGMIHRADRAEEALDRVRAQCVQFDLEGSHIAANRIRAALDHEQ